MTSRTPSGRNTLPENEGASFGKRIGCALWASILGVIVGGGLYFLAGFYGSIWLWPGANQGPLTGIFITGPAGLAVGGILGLIVGGLRLSPRTGLLLGLLAGLIFSLAVFSLTDHVFTLFLIGAGISILGSVGYVSGVVSSPRRNGWASWLFVVVMVCGGLGGCFLLAVMLLAALGVY